MKQLLKQSALGLLAMVLVGCGGTTATVYENTTAQTNNQAHSQLVSQTIVAGISLAPAAVRAQGQLLQANLWATQCLNSKITVLEFNSQRLRTTQAMYKDPQCIEIREDIRVNRLELYYLGNQVVEASGVLASRVDFVTVQSERQELFYIENGALYLGPAQRDSSYTAAAIDFSTPYFPVTKSPIVFQM